MYSIFIVAVLAASVCAIDRDEFMQSCGNIEVIGKCCKDETFIEPELLTVFKECIQLPGPPMCDQDICVATKRGFGFPDGKIDEAKAIKELEANMSKSKSQLDKIKQECFGSNMDKYGPADQCQASKLRQCIRLQLLSTCQNMCNEEECHGAKDSLDKCMKLFM